jgi:two-component system OmpR family sensor kinase
VARRYTAAALTAAGGLVTGAMWLRAHREHAAVERIRSALERVAQGDLSSRLDGGDLADSFNRAVDHMAVMYSALERVVVRQRRFVADASHELRTPLTTVTTTLEMLERFPDMAAERRDRAVADAVSEATRMGVLIQQLIQLARFDAGDPVERQPIEWDALIDEFQQRVADAVAPRTVEVLRSDPLGRGLGDGSLLRQLIDELAANVAGHTPEDCRVTLRVGRNRDGLMVELSDTGPGVRDELRDRIVERFVQADPARHGQGSGLGLALAAAIAASHRGHLDVAATEPHGLTIRVVLPDAGPAAERRRAPRPSRG